MPPNATHRRLPKPIPIQDLASLITNQQGRIEDERRNF